MDLLDCVIIGGGPAGLTAAIYLARYVRNFQIFDAGKSRALLIPRSYNYPGYKNGVSGKSILKKMHEQLERYHVAIHKETVTAVKKEGNLFTLTVGNRIVRAKTVLIATGLVDIEPKLPNIPNAIERGLLRHCPICDVYEVKNQRIAVLGRDEKGFNAALFIRHFSPHVSLLTLGEPLLMDKKKLSEMAASNLVVLENPLQTISLRRKQIATIYLKDFKEPLQFDTIYSALGTINNNELAKALGAKTEKGCLVVDKNQQTSVSGLYAAGDIVADLKQITVGQGQAAIAATAIHNSL